MRSLITRCNRSMRLCGSITSFAGSALAFAALATLAGCGKPFQCRQTLNLTALASGQAMTVNNSFGDISVRADDSVDEVRAHVTLIAKGVTQSEADKALEEIDVRLEPSLTEPGTLVASADFPRHSATRSYSVSWDIVAPPRLTLRIHSDFGNLEAVGFSNGARMTTDFGGINAEVAGALTLRSDFGNVRATVLPGTVGAVNIYTDFGDVDVYMPQDRVGRLRAGTDFGSLDVSLEGCTVRLVRQRGDRFEAELGDQSEPPMVLSTDFGDVRVRVCAPAAERKTGPIS